MKIIQINTQDKIVSTMTNIHVLFSQDMNGPKKILNDTITETKYPTTYRVVFALSVWHILLVVIQIIF